MILQTERLALDELSLDRDELFTFELVNEPGFLTHIGDRGVNDLDGARGYIEKTLASHRDNGFGLWRVTLKATGEAVGMSGLVKQPSLEDPDIGYAFLERFSGRGYAQEAGRAVLAHARDVLKLQRVAAITGQDNPASVAVLGKIGLKPAGLRRIEGYDDDSRYFTVDF